MIYKLKVSEMDVVAGNNGTKIAINIICGAAIFVGSLISLRGVFYAGVKIFGTNAISCNPIMKELIFGTGITLMGTIGIIINNT